MKWQMWFDATNRQMRSNPVFWGLITKHLCLNLNLRNKPKIFLKIISYFVSDRGRLKTYYASKEKFKKVAL